MVAFRKCILSIVTSIFKVSTLIFISTIIVNARVITKHRLAIKCHFNHLKLIKQFTIVSSSPVVDCIISYDSSFD